MTLMLLISLAGLVVGLMAVASNPSPYFAALGLVLVAGNGCCIIASLGGSFLPFVLALIYLGGMLVVFAYTAALAAEPYPESWGSWSVASRLVCYVVGVLFGLSMFIGGPLYDGWGMWMNSDDLGGGFMILRADVEGVAEMFSLGGNLVLLAAWCLLVALFLVLEVTRGGECGTIRAL